MAINVANLVAKLSVDISAFKSGLDQAARETQKFSGLVDQSGRPIVSAFQGVTDQAKKLGTESEKLTSGPLKNLQQAFMGVASQGTSLLGGFMPLLAGFTGLGAAVGLTTLGVVKSIEAFTGFATQVRDLSYLSGGSARDVSVLVNGLENLGVNAETVELGLNRMSAEITSGGESLSKLGISIRDTSGNLKSGLTLFYETVDALGRMTNAVERNSLARDIFGRGWTQMLPVLQRGSGVIREMGEEAYKLGKAIDEGGIEKAYEFQKTLRDLGDAWEGFKIKVGGGIIAPITYILKMLTPSGKEVTPEELSGYSWMYPSMLKPQPTVPGWSDVGAGGLGGTPRAPAGIPSGLGPAELEKQVKLNTQLATLDAQRLAALAAAMPMSQARIDAEKKAMEAALKVKQIQIAGELDLRDLTKKTTEEQTETARLRIGTAQMFAAQRVAIEKDAEEKARQERLRIGKLEIQDRARVADEESIAQAYEFKGNIQAQYDEFLTIGRMTEHYRGLEFVREQEQQKRIQEIRAAGFAYDDTANQMRAEDYEVTEDQIVAARWAAVQKNLERAAYEVEEFEKYRDQEVAQQQAALKAQLYEANSYFDKMRLGLSYHVTDWRTADQKILDITKEMAQFAQREVSDIYFAGLTGQLEDFEDVWRAAWKSLARVMADELSRYTLSSLFGGLTGGGTAGWLGPAISTGWNALSSWGSDLGSWLGFLQGGMWEVPDLPGKELAVLHPGEMVVPPGMAAVLRAMFGSPGGFVAGQSWYSGGSAEMQAPSRGPMSPGETLADVIGSMLTSGERFVFGLAHAANALFMGAKLLTAQNPLVGALNALTMAGLAQMIDAYALSTATGITLAQAKGIVAGLAQLSITNAAIVSALISMDLEDIAQGKAMRAMLEAETLEVWQTAEWDAAQAAMQAAQVSIDAAITAQASREAALTEATAITGYEPSSWDTYGTYGPGGAEIGSDVSPGAADSWSGGGEGGYGPGGAEIGSDVSGNYQHGGIIPGPIGAPRLIIAHGGERVQTREQAGGGNLTINVHMHGDIYGAGGRDDFVRRVAADLRQFARRIPGVNLIPMRA